MSAFDKPAANPFAMKTQLTDGASWEAFELEVREIAAAAPINLVGGLISEVISVADFQAFPGYAGPVAPPQPADLANGAGAGTVENHKRAMQLYENYMTLTRYLWAAIVASISRTLKVAITDPVTKIIMLTTNEIMTHFRVLYGTTTAAMIQDLTTQLANPLEGYDLTTFVSHSATFNIVVAKLAAANQPISQAQAMMDFERSCLGQAPVAEAIQRYIHTNPAIAARTLANLMAYVNEQLTNVTTATGGFAAAATAAATKAVIPLHKMHQYSSLSMTQADRSALVKDIAAEMHALGFVKGAQAQPHPVRQLAPVGRGPQNMKHYCYRHGYGHKGVDCKVMLAVPSAYTAAMLQARSPTDVAGGHT